MTTHRAAALQLGLLAALIGVYFLLVVWPSELCHTGQGYSIFSKPKTPDPTLPLSGVLHHNSSLTFDSSTTAKPTPPALSDPDLDLESRTDSVMLVHDFNAAPHTQHRLSFKGCKHQCALTNDSSRADLLYLNAGQMSPKTTLPVYRKKNQIWLLYSREPPTFPRFSYLKRRDLRGQINWTRAVYADATFPLKYGILQERTPYVERDFDVIYESKTNAVAWFVGHCQTQSRREEYVRRMTSRIDVHVYGVCGNMTCGLGGYNMGGYKSECLGMLSKKYKFYLAFENSLCEEYVTEKFFNLFLGGNLTVDVIPVVRGGADYKRLFNPAAFVDAADFRSPEQLADHLVQLAGDKTKYIDMLRVKSKYVFGRDPKKFECGLCRSLHLRDIPRQSYWDIHSFWTDPKRCHEPRDLDKEQSKE